MITNKGIKRKESIVSTASLLFMIRPIKEVSVANITSKAGIAKGTFYTYFKSKDDLIWLILATEVQALYSLFENFPSLGYSSHALDLVVDQLIDYVIKHKKQLQLVKNIEFYSYLGKDQILRKCFDNQEVINPILRWLETGYKDGHLKVFDLRFTTFFLSKVIDETILEVVSEQGSFTLNDLRDNLKFLLKNMLGVSHD